MRNNKIHNSHDILSVKSFELAQRGEMLTELLNPLWLTYNMNERFYNKEMVVLS